MMTHNESCQCGPCHETSLDELTEQYAQENLAFRTERLRPRVKQRLGDDTLFEDRVRDAVDQNNPALLDHHLTFYEKRVAESDPWDRIVALEHEVERLTRSSARAIAVLTAAVLFLVPVVLFLLAAVLRLRG